MYRIGKCYFAPRGIVPVVLYCLKADFQSVELSERAEIPLFAGENVALKLNR